MNENEIREDEIDESSSTARVIGAVLTCTAVVAVGAILLERRDRKRALRLHKEAAE